MYGEAIIERLHRDCKLRDNDNPARKVFINTVGAILDDFDIFDSLEAPYLQNATGVYLDLHGKDLGVKRKHLESDDDYRKRLVYETLGYLTVDYLRNVYDLPLYVYLDDFDVSDNTLTSDNPYINEDGFMSIADDETQSILESKFILDTGLHWIEVD